MKQNIILNEDCLPGLSKLPDNSCDICITSPPYKHEDGYNPVLISSIFYQIHRVLKNNSLFFMNFGHLANFKFRPFDVCDMAICRGFTLNDTIIWVKNHFTPLQGNKRLNNLTEFIFLLYKGDMPDLDRLAIGVPYTDKSNAARFSGGRDLRCGGNVWNIKYPTITKKEQRLHKDGFPVELPERCLKLSALPKGSVVLDPFMGAGSTALAAKNLGMNYVGFERNEEYYKISIERLKL